MTLINEIFDTCCIESWNFKNFRCNLLRILCQQDDVACQWVSVNLCLSQTKGYMFSFFPSFHFSGFPFSSAPNTAAGDWLPPDCNKVATKLQQSETWDMSCLIISDLNSKIFIAHYSTNKYHIKCHTLIKIQNKWNVHDTNMYTNEKACVWIWLITMSTAS